MMGMVDELETFRLGVKLEEDWCGALMYVDDIVLVADSGVELQTMLEMVQANQMREDEVQLYEEQDYGSWEKGRWTELENW